MTTQTLANQTAVSENIRVREGETWEQYRDRFHTLVNERGIGRPDGKCHAPNAYSLCRASMYWRFAHRELRVHGGWGWPTEWHTSKSGTARIALFPSPNSTYTEVEWRVTVQVEKNRRVESQQFPLEQDARDFANTMWSKW